jgi:hypothetical protein
MRDTGAPHSQQRAELHKRPVISQSDIRWSVRYFRFFFSLTQWPWILSASQPASSL